MTDGKSSSCVMHACYFKLKIEYSKVFYEETHSLGLLRMGRFLSILCIALGRVCVCVCIHMHVCLKGLMFECTSRMGYNDRLSATTAAGIFRMSLSTYINGETRTRDKIQDSYTLQDTEIGCNPKKVGVLCKM